MNVLPGTPSMQNSLGGKTITFCTFYRDFYKIKCWIDYINLEMLGGYVLKLFLYGEIIYSEIISKGVEPKLYKKEGQVNKIPSAGTIHSQP